MILSVLSQAIECTSHLVLLLLLLLLSFLFVLREGSFVNAAGPLDSMISMKVTGESESMLLLTM